MPELPRSIGFTLEFPPDLAPREWEAFAEMLHRVANAMPSIPGAERITARCMAPDYKWTITAESTSVSRTELPDTITAPPKRKWW